jgi:hypothetical protein
MPRAMEALLPVIFPPREEWEIFLFLNHRRTINAQKRGGTIALVLLPSAIIKAVNVSNHELINRFSYSYC